MTCVAESVKQSFALGQALTSDVPIRNVSSIPAEPRDKDLRLAIEFDESSESAKLHS